MIMLSILVVTVGLVCLPTVISGHPADRSYGTFQQPAARARPRFRYWLPDASVDSAVLQQDILSAGAKGIGGVELLPFYNYGGGAPPIDWSIYGFGTTAFQSLFKAALEAHQQGGLLMDFAMGPNQGQGVPATMDNPGLQWDLITRTATVPSNGSFDEVLPGWDVGELVAAVSALVVSQRNVSIPPRAGQGPPYNYTELLLGHDSLVDLTQNVSQIDGRLASNFPPGDGSSYHIVFVFYQKLTHAKNLDPHKNVSGSIFDNGCYIVDHFDAKGARVMTDFWDEYILINGTKELLSAVGNSGWEDSMELLSNVSWSPSILDRFQRERGYSLRRFLPLIVFGNNNVNIQSSAPGLIRSQLDTADGGIGYVNDFRTTLAEAYQEYLGVLLNWTRSELNLQYSSQVSYNLPMDMEASIPYNDVPECESLQFRDNVDSYRQFSGVAYLAGKRTVSIELGAVFGSAFTYTIPDLLFSMNRAASGGVNQFIIHGQAYGGNYSKTTWPGYIPFGYRVSDPYFEKQPDWDHGLEAALRYIGRIMYVQQQGIPRIDVALYNRQSATDPIVHTLYSSSDLQEKGWSYAYISPSNFALPQSQVSNTALAPDGPSFRAMIVESSQNLTLQVVKYLSDYAASGLPIILSGGDPGYYPSAASSDRDSVEAAIRSLSGARNVYSVAKGQAAQQLASLGLVPRVGVQTNGTWFTTWRQDEAAEIDYAYVFCDTNSSTGDITVATNKRPFTLNPWTGEILPVLVYTQDENFTTIPLSLAGNQTAIFAFTNGVLEGHDSPTSFHLTNLDSTILGYNHSAQSDFSMHVPATSTPYTATTSLGGTILVNGSDVSPAIMLTDWTLTAEHWTAPQNFNDSTIIADKYNTTHTLSSLTSWLEIPELANVSGVGYYTSEFSWPPPLSPDPPGAYISFSKILHAVTVHVNGQLLPPLDYNNANADISSYLQLGTNQISAVVPTTMWNYIQTLLPNIQNAGAPVSFSGGPYGSPSAASDNGLVGLVSVIPYKSVTVTQ